MAFGEWLTPEERRSIMSSGLHWTFIIQERQNAMMRAAMQAERF